MQVVQGLEWVKDNFVAPAVVVMALGGKSLQRRYTVGNASQVLFGVVYLNVAHYTAIGNCLLSCMLHLTDQLAHAVLLWLYQQNPQLFGPGGLVPVCVP